jgi:uncharacterized protein YbjT (DUF2867 family)
VKVAVFGASGMVGRALLPLLAERHDVVAVSRREQPADDVRIRWVVADAADPADVDRVLEGVNVVHYLVHSLGSPDFARRDRWAAATVALAADRAGVSQIVYLGGLGDDREELSEHLRSRRETERALGVGGVPVTAIRAAMVVGQGSAAFETIVALVDRLPAMVCPRWVSTPTQPIALADIVRYLAAVAGMERALGEAFDAGGPQTMSYRDMMQRIARLRGRRPLIVEVPILTPRLSSLWLNLVTPVNAAVARPLIDGLRVPTLAHENRLRDLVPFPLTSFEDAARSALGQRA